MSKKYFDEYINLVKPVKNLFFIGMEIEFRCGRGYATKYNRDVFEVSEGYESILGFDGSGVSTKEFRSPVFSANNSENAVNDLEKFVIEVNDYLIKEYDAKFSPWKYKQPFGIHFSISGKFLNDNDIIKRSRRIQSKLGKLIDPKYLDQFEMRESEYPGHIPDEYHTFKQFTSYYENCIRVKDYMYYDDLDYKIAELRFVPSCLVETWFPYMEFILLEKPEPNNIIRCSG